MKRHYLTILFVLVLNALFGQEIRTGTYNIRRDAESDKSENNGWEKRKGPLSRLIAFHDFDILGTQEVMHNQLQDLLALLPDYSSIGVGRDDGGSKGEYSPIFYKRSRFKVLKQGYFWLSTTPDIPSKGWDAAFPRICTWGIFKDLQSGKQFLFVNSHFDHRGNLARKNSAELILNQIEVISKRHIPVIFTGDFNEDQNSATYKTIATSSQLKDAFTLATQPYLPTGTFNNFKVDVSTSSRIDHVFNSKEFLVKKYGVLTDSYHLEELGAEKYNPDTAPKEVYMVPSAAKLPSDHYPVFVLIAFK